jgi:hypothetical protein
MGPARIAQNIVDGNREDAARAIIADENPANLTVLVLAHLVADHDYERDRAIETMQSLTNRPEFWETT